MILLLSLNNVKLIRKTIFREREREKITNILTYKKKL